MKRLGLFLGIALLVVTYAVIIGQSSRAQVGPPNQILCSNFATFTGTGSAATVITGKAGQTIYICGWHVTSTSGSSTTFQFTSGTGTNCATSSANITPALNVTSSAPSVDHIDFAMLSFAGPTSICVNAPSSDTGGLWYLQL